MGEANAGGLELAFAAFLESAPDVQAHGKNYTGVGFKLDYVQANGDLANYVPDFFVRTVDGIIWLVETKGREELDLPQKMARLRQWCDDATAADPSMIFRYLYVDEGSFHAHKPASFAGLAAVFREYQP